MTRWTEADLAAFRRRNGSVEKPTPKPRERSELEIQLEYQVLAHGLGGIAEYRPLPPRRWRLDRAWPEILVGVEVQGMVHRIKGRFKQDIEKRAALLLAGWRVLEVDGEAIRDGRAIAWIQALLKRRERYASLLFKAINPLRSGDPYEGGDLAREIEQALK